MGVAVGSVSVPGSTGTFSVSGLSFQPVAVIFFNQHNHLGAHSWFMGCATASDEQWVLWAGSNTEISGYTHRKHEGRTDRCCLSYTTGNAGTIAWAAEFVSFQSDGFTLNLTERSAVAGGEGGNLYYMALGGDHIPQAYAGTFVTGGATGTESVTDPGFLPTSLIVAHNGDETWDAGALSEMLIGTGVTDGSAQYSAWAFGATGTDTLCVHAHRTDAVAVCASIGHDFRMELDTFDASGFTVDTVDAWPHDILFGYLALAAEGAVAGYGEQPAADGDVDYATPGLLPGGVFFCWNGADTPATTGSTTGPMRPGVGALTATAEKHSSGIFRASTSFGVFTSDGYQIGDEALGFWGTGNGIGGSDNLSQASTSLASFDEDSFTLTWDVSSPDADRAFGWLALPGELTFVPQIYRILRVPTSVT